MVKIHIAQRSREAAFLVIIYVFTIIANGYEIFIIISRVIFSCKLRRLGEKKTWNTHLTLTIYAWFLLVRKVNETKTSLWWKLELKLLRWTIRETFSQWCSSVDETEIHCVLMAVNLKTFEYNGSFFGLLHCRTSRSSWRHSVVTRNHQYNSYWRSEKYRCNRFFSPETNISYRTQDVPQGVEFPGFCENILYTVS